MAYRLFTANRNYSSWSLRPWVLMRMLGIGFDEEQRMFAPGSNRAAFRAFAPNGTVPCLHDGDAVVWLPKQRVLVAGDIGVAPVPFGFGSYPNDWIHTLEKLQAYDFKVLIPGHGAPQHDRTYLARLVAAIEEVRTKVAPLVRQGVSLDDARKQLDFSDQAQGFVGADTWLRRWFKEYWIGPLLTSAYKEARGEPIIQSLAGE